MFNWEVTSSPPFVIFFANIARSRAIVLKLWIFYETVNVKRQCIVLNEIIMQYFH